MSTLEQSMPGSPAAGRIGSCGFSISGSDPSAYECIIPTSRASRVAVLITFAASTYPFEKHCRYAALRDPRGKRTFANLDFHTSPPGMRVGPWPGWRGIPEMPESLITCNGTTKTLKYHFWGDEISQRRVRGCCYLPAGSEGKLEVRIQDSRLQPSRADFYQLPKITVTPEALPDLPIAGHPRILLSDEELARLRSPARMGHWGPFANIRSLLDHWGLVLTPTAEAKIPPGPEALSDEDRLLIGAYVGLLNPTAESITRAREAYFTYLWSTRTPGFGPLTIDTQSGEVLFLLTVGYDWLYNSLSEEQRAEARTRLSEVADICWGHLGYERDDYAQAHFLGCGMGLLSFSLLFRNEHPRANEWGEYLYGVLRWVCRSLASDGFYPHGLNMWIYEFGFLLRWIEILRTATGIDLWRETGSALVAASRFRAAATSPDGLLGVTLGDPQYRVGGDSWCHYLIAARTGSTVSQWIGDLLRELPSEGVDFRLAPARRRVYEHLWFSETVTPRPPEERATWFLDGGQGFARSERSVFTFRSGRPLGTHRYGAGVVGGYGHADPCNGAFLICDGEGLVASGPGPVYRRDSIMHNVVTIDGQGQIGDGAVWLPDFFPPEVHPGETSIEVAGQIVTVTADVAASYLPHLGVTRMDRHLLLWPGRFVAGADMVELRESHQIQWNIHSWWEFIPYPPETSYPIAFSNRNNDGMRVLIIEPRHVETKRGLTEFVPAYPHDGRQDWFLQLSTEGHATRFLWLLLLSEEATPRLEQNDATQIVFSDGTRLRYDRRWIMESVRR